jgi:glycosyltransferase involved in cell wall biosynthesis
VGPGRSGYLAELREAAEGLGVADRLHIVDTVPARFLPSYLRTADFGVHPMENTCLNHQLALPNKLFDYVFAGIPVAVSDLREMSRFVTTYGVGEVFNPGDPGSLARALRSVSENKAKYSQNIKARGDLHSNYAWPAQARKLLTAYRELGGRGSTEPLDAEVGSAPVSRVEFVPSSGPNDK